MKHLAPWFCVAIALLAGGCPRNEYVLTLKPTGDGLERTLTCSRGEPPPRTERTDVPAEEVNRLKGLYPTHDKLESEKAHRFQGVFSGEMPRDLDGAGSFNQIKTTLGTVSFYVERFRGDDNPAGRLARRQLAANQITDLLVGWFGQEAGNTADFEKLRSFLDNDFRQDLKSVSLYVWQTEAAAEYGKSEDQLVQDFLVRVGQFLVERGYFKITEIPIIAGKDAAQIVKLPQRVLARKMGVADSEPIPSALAFLNDTQDIQRSWSKYCPTTDLYASKAFEAHKKQGGESTDLSAEEFTGDLLKAVFEWELFPSGDRLKVNLSLSATPEHTNGTWDEKSRTVQWNYSLEQGEPRRLPPFAYATWTSSNDEFQAARFGKVILKGKSLIEYGVWRVGLRENRAAEWDKFIAALNPGPDLEKQISTFSFSDERVSEDSVGRRGIELLLEGLK